LEKRIFKDMSEGTIGREPRAGVVRKVAALPIAFVAF